MLTIADVSKWQAAVDYGAFVRGDGDGFICKVGGSNGGGTLYTDTRYRQHALGTRAVGGLLGHYWMNGDSSPIANATYFVRSLVEYQTGDPLVLDIEDIDGSPHWRPAEAALFFATIEYLLPNPNLFAYMNDNPLNDGWESVRDSGVRLWKATYTTSATTKTGPWPEWSMWQYTDRGVVSGFLGDISRAKDDAWVTAKSFNRLLLLTA